MKIVFTSCMDASRVPNQPIWSHIQSLQPDVLMLLGDQIYMDWGDMMVSGWRGQIEAGGSAKVDTFAREMHRRYKLQAAVPEFIALLKSMAASAKQVIVTWDDHDFAWNDSVGVAPGPYPGAEAQRIWGAHGVQPEVKEISLKLLIQFRQFTANPDAPYPSLEDAKALPGCLDASDPASGVPSHLEGDAGPIDFMVLDTRFNRQPRPVQGSTILGKEQLGRLVDLASRSDGLLILGAGSPMRHKYLLGEQDWSGGRIDEYVDFKALLNAAKRPILYLSGDVHHNAWGGRVKQTASENSEVIQILSSPAAIDNMLMKHFPPSYCELQITGSATSGTINCKLMERQGDPGSQTYALSPGEPGAGRSFKYASYGFPGDPRGPVLDGEASDDATWLSADDPARDLEPLAVLNCVPRKSDALGDLSAPLDKLVLLDDSFKKHINPGGGIAGVGAAALDAPEPLLAQVAEDAAVLNLTHTETDMEGLMRAAFRAAKAASRPSVVLFVHGTGKSPVDAIDQGYGLRALYNCEPIVFTWPAGRAEGGLSSWFAAFDVKRAVPEASEQFRWVLKQFSACAADPEFAPYVAGVVLARSAGAVLLQETLAGGASNEKLYGITRLVLSSPAIKEGKFHAKFGNAFRMPQIPETVITINPSDGTLRNAKWASQVGGILGVAIKDIPDNKKDRIPTGIYLQYEGVGELHDYLWTRLNLGQMAVNRAMLTKKKGDFKPGDIEHVSERPDAADWFIVNPDG